MLSRRKLAARSLVLLGFGLLCLGGIAGERLSRTDKSHSGMMRFDVPGGEPLFALSIRGGEEAASPRDVVIVIDTSASQMGAHRRQALAVLDACLSTLSSEDRVRLIAVDTQVKELSTEFAAPKSESTQAAVAALQMRVPLGATNLQPALEKALKSFDKNRVGSLVYIGDGMSTGKLIEWSGFRTLVNQFRQKQIPVNSYAVGPKTDLQVLGVLAQHTGGIVMVDSLVDDEKTTAEQLGRKLAHAAEANVFFADQLTLSPSGASLAQAFIPPVRSDRDTIVLGKGTLADSLEVTVRRGDKSLTWKVKTAEAQPGNSFLANLWQQAETSEGLLVAVAGTEMLNQAREEFDNHVEGLIVAGRNAVATRDLKQAELYAQAVRQIDPANTEAETIFNASQRIKDKTTAVQVALKRQLDETEPPAPGLNDGDEKLPSATVRSEKLIDEERQLRQVKGEQLKQQVSRVVDMTTKLGAKDPDSALGLLKRTLTTVIASSDVDPDIREKLRSRVQASIDKLNGQLTVIEQRRIQDAEKVASIRARELANDHLMQRDEQLEQLINQVSALLYEGFLGNANAFERAEGVARAAFELAPYSGVTSTAIVTSEAAGQADKSFRLRYARYDNFLATLHQVEMAHIPFPDEPPIIYPPPEVWRALTLRRSKWKSVDLMRWNKAEEKIRSSFDKPTNADFNEMPLEEAIKYFQELHSINIMVDKQALSEEGIGLDTPITMNLQQVSFRSVLKLLLEPINLTYVIENEVMKITTTAKAGEKLSTRVYPVADLVIPIITPRGGGMGGGMGGGGMGMGGGGMGMGGMGMMNVADPDADVFTGKAAKEGKKKALTTR